MRINLREFIENEDVMKTLRAYFVIFASRRALTCTPYSPISPDLLTDFFLFLSLFVFLCGKLMASGFGAVHIKFRYAKRRSFRLTCNETLMTLSRCWTPSILLFFINNLDVVLGRLPFLFFLRFSCFFRLCFIFFSFETRHLVESRRDEHCVTDWQKSFLSV